MRGMLLVIASFLLTVFCWGMYGPVLHEGQSGMSQVAGEYARWRPFACVGLSYFAIGVVVPVAWLLSRGEKGHWTTYGTVVSLSAGTLGALGALGIILAFNFGGKPSYVMPLVFGGAPVVNSFITIYLARRVKEIGPMFMAGLVMVVLGAVTVLTFKPQDGAAAKTVDATAVAEGEQDAPGVIEAEAKKAGNFALQVLSIVMVVSCWGTYGATLHKGQAAMHNSRMRPLICVGLAYFVIATIGAMLVVRAAPEPSEWSLLGTTWSLAAGALGALGALGIILSFNFGGKPVYVMPIVFGGAPVVNTLVTATVSGAFDSVGPLQLALFLAGLILVVSGAAMVLVFAPKGPPPKPAPPAPAPKPKDAAAPAEAS